MSKRITRAAKTYNRAHYVVLLWVASVGIPVALIPAEKWRFGAVNFGALALLLAVGTLLFRFVRRRLAQGAWGQSDAVVYLVIPGLLFFVYTSIMLSELVR